jgi:hypothetical protein
VSWTDRTTTSDRCVLTLLDDAPTTPTVLVRDDVVVTVRQSNCPTNDPLGSIVTRIRG